MRRHLSVLGAIALSGLILRAAPPHDETDLGPDYDIYKVSKSGALKIASDVAIGSFNIKKGNYLFAHRVDGRLHIVTLTRLGAGGSETYEIPLTVIPEPRPARRSELIVKQLPDRSMIVTLIAVEGEAGDHLPQNFASR
jgi:hypothetical protein